MVQLEEHTTVTRVGYCPNCAKQKHPYKGQKYLVLGNQGYKVKKVNEEMRFKGFTPHFYIFSHIVKGVAIYYTACCMEGCSVTFTINHEQDCYDFAVSKKAWEKNGISLSDFHALMHYKRDSDYHFS